MPYLHQIMNTDLDQAAEEFAKNIPAMTQPFNDDNSFDSQLADFLKNEQSPESVKKIVSDAGRFI